MKLNELIAEAQAYIERNREPEVPSYDPGEEEVKVQSLDGTYESEIVSFETANTPWLIVHEPDYTPVDY